MTIHEFSKLIAKKEGIKKQVNIAQIKEILNVINHETKGGLYTAIKMKKSE